MEKFNGKETIKKEFSSSSKKMSTSTEPFTFSRNGIWNSSTGKSCDLKKTTLWPLFYGWGSTASRLEPLRGGSLLFTTSPQKFLVLTLSTSEG